MPVHHQIDRPHSELDVSGLDHSLAWLELSFSEFSNIFLKLFALFLIFNEN